MIIKKCLKFFFKKIGIDVRFYHPAVLERAFKKYKVDTIFDIGANQGQSIEYFRNLGFTGKIYSFEPIPEFYTNIKNKYAHDAKLSVVNCAIGTANGDGYINITSGSGGASSMLDMTDNVKNNVESIEVVNKVKVDICTLDEAIDKYFKSNDGLFLKIDVQGFEKEVIKSGLKNMNNVIGIKIEMSLVENYKGEAMFDEIVGMLYALGFRLIDVEGGWRNKKNLELYQIDGIFFRTDRLK